MCLWFGDLSEPERQVETSVAGGLGLNTQEEQQDDGGFLGIVRPGMSQSESGLSYVWMAT